METEFVEVSPASLFYDPMGEMELSIAPDGEGGTEYLSNRYELDEAHRRWVHDTGGGIDRFVYSFWRTVPSLRFGFFGIYFARQSSVVDEFWTFNTMTGLVLSAGKSTAQLRANINENAPLKFEDLWAAVENEEHRGAYRELIENSNFLREAAPVQYRPGEGHLAMPVRMGGARRAIIIDDEP